MAVSKRLRFEILRRDNHTCRYCGESAPGVKLVVDHVVPETLGGQTEPENLVAACVPCNTGKASIAPDSPFVEDVKQDALRWARAMEIARVGAQVTRDERNAHRDAFEAAWNRWTYRRGLEYKPLDLPIGWPLTVDGFIAAGLDDDDLADAVDSSMRRTTVSDKYRYFCGICWRMVKDRQEAALVVAPLCDGDFDDDPDNPWVQ